MRNQIVDRVDFREIITSQLPACDQIQVFAHEIRHQWLILVKSCNWQKLLADGARFDYWRRSGWVWKRAVEETLMPFSESAGSRSMYPLGTCLCPLNTG